MYASDGLPERYNRAIRNDDAMSDLKRLVFDTLPGLVPEQQTAADVMDVTNINPLFFDEVDEFVDEWHEKETVE